MGKKFVAEPQLSFYFSNSCIDITTAFSKNYPGQNALSCIGPKTLKKMLNQLKIFTVHYN